MAVTSERKAFEREKSEKRIEKRGVLEDSTACQWDIKFRTPEDGKTMEVSIELLIIKKTPQLAKSNAWTDALKKYGVFWGRSLKDACTVLHPLPER
jgi:hypothetical protein